MSSEPLRFPPLKEIAFEINFAPHLRVEDRIADFQDEVKSDFPNYVPEILLRLPASVYVPSKRHEEHPVQPIKTHTFASLDNQRVLRVSTVSLNLVVQNYLHFDDYLASASKCLNAAIEKFQVKDIFRIGLRYINLIKIERVDAGFNLRRYVCPILSEEIEKRADAFLVEITEKHDARKLTIRSGLRPYESDSSFREYLLDFDCFSDQKQTIAPIDTILTSFHDTVERRFHEAVTKEYLEYMRTGRWP